MGISVRVINQDTGEIIEKTGIICPIDNNYCLGEGLVDSLKLLKYVDAYGDACFNPLQFDDLRKDCEIVKQNEIEKPKPYSKEIIDAMDKLISLIDRRKNDIHTFIQFFGD